MKVTTKLQINPILQNFVRPSEHSLYSPSAAERWIGGCAYSIQATKDIPSESSSYSEEGTVAHAMCEAVFRKEFLGLDIPVELSMQLLQYGEEMYEHALNYVNVISYWLNNKDAVGEVLWYGLEKGVPVFPEKGCFGTADCLIVGTKASVVIDFKYGCGKSVSADTPQLKVYAAGIIRHLINIPHDYKVHAVVYQPRIDPAPREMAYDVATLNQFLGTIWNAILESERPDLSPVEGRHCFWCPANRTKDITKKCPVIKEKPLKLAQENFAKFLADMSAPVETLTAPNPARDEAIIKLMTLYPLIKEVVENAQEEFMMRLGEGENIPGVRIIEEVGRREINAEDETKAAELIKTHFPQVDPMKIIPAKAKLKTLTELEKELGKNKLDPLCIRKVKKKIDVIDEKAQSILGEMAAYAEAVNYNKEAL